MKLYEENNYKIGMYEMPHFLVSIPFWYSTFKRCYYIKFAVIYIKYITIQGEKKENGQRKISFQCQKF